MKNKITYSFHYSEKCNMCNSSSYKILGKRLNKSQGKNPKQQLGICTTIVKCSNCGLIYSNPQPVPADLQDHYGISPESYFPDNYFETTINSYKNETEQLKILMEITPNMRSLDVGAGMGHGMIAFANIGFDAYGLEPWKLFYEHAISQGRIAPEKIQCEKIENANYPMAYFDFISFAATLEHLYDPAGSIERAMTWLKPGGIILLEVASASWLTNKIYNLYFSLKCTDYVSNLSPMHKPFHLYEFAMKSFFNNARNNNYEIVSHEYFVCSTYLPKIMDVVLKPLMRWTNTGMYLCVWIRKKS